MLLFPPFSADTANVLQYEKPSCPLRWVSFIPTGGQYIHFSLLCQLLQFETRHKHTLAPKFLVSNDFWECVFLLCQRHQWFTGGSVKFLTSSMYSIYSDSTWVKGATSPTFLTGKNAWGGAAQMSPDFPYKRHKSGSQAVSCTHRATKWIWISKLIALQILSNVWVLLIQAWEMRRETFEHLQKSLCIRSVLDTTSMSKTILNNVKVWSYSRVANRYHHYVNVQM